MTQLCCLIHSGETTFETSGEGEVCHPARSPFLRAKCYHLQTPVTQTAFHHFAIKQQQSVRCWCPRLRPAREDYSCLPAASGKPTCCTVVLPGDSTLPRRQSSVALSLKLCCLLWSIYAGDLQQTCRALFLDVQRTIA